MDKIAVRGCAGRAGGEICASGPHEAGERCASDLYRGATGALWSKKGWEVGRRGRLDALWGIIGEARRRTDKKLREERR